MIKNKIEVQDDSYRINKEQTWILREHNKRVRLRNKSEQTRKQSELPSTKAPTKK